MQAFVLGMHRSGTSAVARVLNLMGFYFGGEEVGTGRSSENEKGFWERRDVRALNDAILFDAGCDWDCLSALDLDALAGQKRAEYSALATDIVMRLDAHRPWFVKEPRLCALFPVWRDVLEMPVCVHVCRNPLEVADSLHARNGIPIEVGVALWEAYNVRALAASANLPRAFVRYEELLRRPMETVRSMRTVFDGLGDYRLRSPEQAEVQRFLEAKLHRHRRTEEEFHAFATAPQSKLYECLCRAATGEDVEFAAAVVSEESSAVLGAYEATVDVAERRTRADARGTRRSELGLALQVAFKDLDLHHANERIKDAVAQRQAAEDRRQRLERQVGELEDTARDLRAQLARELDQANDLRRETEAEWRRLEGEAEAERRRWERQVGELEDTARDLRAQLARELDQANDLRRETEAEWRRLEGEAEAERRRWEREVDELEDTVRDLQAQLARARDQANDLRSQRESLANKNATLRSQVRRVATQAAARRAEVRGTVKDWDIELGFRKSKIADLKQRANTLNEHIRALLESRRWRLGNALVSLASLAPLRGRRERLQDRLARALDLRTSRHEAIAAVVDDLDELPSALAPLVVDGDEAAAVLGTDAKRDYELLRMPVQRRLAVARRIAETVALRQHVEELVQIAETLCGSWRWRIGNALLGLPRRATFQRQPRTAADSVADLVGEYRADPIEVDLPPELLDEERRGRESPKVVSSVVPMFHGNELWRSAKVDVVVCVHNALEHVERCLVSVLTRTTTAFRLIVVNDGSDDRTTARLRELAAGNAAIDVLETNGPIGYTGAANRGLRESTAEYVVLLNSDTIVPRLWIEGMLDCMASGEEVGLVGPLSNAASWQSVPERSDDAGGWKVNDLPIGYNVDDFGELVYALSRRRFPRVEFLNGFCLMFRRAVLDRVGLLDEAAFPQGYGEENDYCMRARSAGFELAIADHCYVHHAKSKSFGARRAELARQGDEALFRKHSREAIEAGTRQVRNCTDLAYMRTAIDRFLRTDERTWAQASNGEQGNRPKTCDVLFLLPVRGASGGANSVVQEVAGMRALGIDARVATHNKYIDSFKLYYRSFFDDGGFFLFYGSDDELYAQAVDFDVVVATLWSTPALIAPFANRHPEKLYFYYVQDYEPWFFPHDPQSEAVARESYTLVPNMVLMAKTDWICRTVLDKHGCRVNRVVPSLDKSVYYPPPLRPQASGIVTVAAMVRPSTARRAPLRTLRVLKAVRKIARADVRIEVFGVDQTDLERYIQANREALGDGFPFESRGVQPREGVAALLRDADVFIDLSDYQAFGRTGLEAMACGCAVVLPAAGGADEYAVHGENAVVVDTSSFEKVVVELTKLVDDEKSRQRLAKRGIETAAQYNIARAALSELGVFRQAWTLRFAQCDADDALFKRGVAPVRQALGNTVPLSAT